MKLYSHHGSRFYIHLRITSCKKGVLWTEITFLVSVLFKQRGVSFQSELSNDILYGASKNDF